MNDFFEQRIALVTGGSGGIGAEVCKQLAEKNYKVILSAKDINKANAICDSLNKAGLKVIPYKLDVTSEEDINGICQYIIKEYKKLDVLINNAAIYLDNRVNGVYPKLLDLSFEMLKTTMEVNFYGAYLLSTKILPLMQKNDYGRIVNVSSGMARFEDLDTRGPFYRISKVSLNALTCILAKLSEGYDICINSVCPGWVRSQMGGPAAVRTPSEGAAGIIWAATLPTGGPSGEFFRDGEKLDWCQKLGDPY